jgi:hypothetical protein
MANHIHASAQSIELGPPAAESGIISYDEDTSDQHSGHLSKEPVHQPAIGDAKDTVMAEEIDDGRRLSRQTSRLSHSSPDAPPREPAENVQEKHVAAEPRNASALLNLPPPLPFDLRVSDLWVGVPLRGPST